MNSNSCDVLITVKGDSRSVMTLFDFWCGRKQPSLNMFCPAGKTYQNKNTKFKSLF